MQSSYPAFLFCHVRNRSHPKSINPESVNPESVSSAVRFYSHTRTIHIHSPGLIQKNGIRPGGPPAVVHDLNPHIELLAGKVELSMREAFSAACKE